MDRLGWIGRDLRYAVRSLVRDRGSVALSVAALSLGIGATTVIFSVVYSVLINAFPFEDSTRIVHFYVHGPEGRGGSHWYPAPEFAEYRAQNSVFSHVLGGASLEVLYRIGDATYRVRGAHIDTQALTALGVRPILGRPMAEADGAPNAPPTFLMSDRLWGEQFNRDPSILGTTFSMNGVTRTLIAILPPRFLMHGADVFFPTRMTADLTDALIGGRGGRPLSVWTYARLNDDVTPEQAAANLEVVARNVARLNPGRYREPLQASVRSLADVYTASSLKEMVYILAGAVLMLLMIACSNVANLLLARATAKEGELALRASLGASRARLMQQLLAESFVLAVAGTAIGALLALAGITWVQTAIPASALPSEMQIRFSSQALLATVAVTFIVTILCGLAPALRAARGDLRNRLTGSGKGLSTTSRRGRLRTVLVAVQITLAIVLLVGAGLMMRTLLAIQNIDPGVNTENVLVGQLAVPAQQRHTPEERVLFLKRVMERIATLPGVSAVSPTVGVPLQWSPRSPVSIPGTTPAEKWTTAVELVGNDYFRTIGLPLLSGRLLSAADVDGGRRVAVVNQRFVREYLEGAHPIGRTMQLPMLDQAADATAPSLFEIVGVVGDSRNEGLQEDVSPQAFVPYTIPGPQPSTLLVQTTENPLGLQHRVRQQVWAVDPGVAVMNVGGTRGSLLLNDVLNRNTLAAPRFGVGLLGTFAAVGLVLSAIGVFSVMAYTVSLQTHEIGIRMALGAEPRSVMRRVLIRGLRPIVAGVLLGMLASYWLAGFLDSHIYGVTTTDPWTFAGVVLVLAAVSVGACLWPARRAMRVDPLVALRSE
jgi:putative ABC transport system permease protein